MMIGGELDAGVEKRERVFYFKFVPRRIWRAPLQVSPRSGRIFQRFEGVEHNLGEGASVKGAETRKKSMENKGANG